LLNINIRNRSHSASRWRC